MGDQALSQILLAIFARLMARYRPQYWWPAGSPFEVMVGAILTQNTGWRNVERAIENLRRERLLNPGKLYRLPRRKLARMIKPAGYYNIKAKRLSNFLAFLHRNHRADIKKISSLETGKLRQQLLAVNGIGPETADSILLYALNKPVFVVDVYTRRVLGRHGLVKDSASYDEVQKIFMQNVQNKVKLYNEYHALLVRLAKEFCLKNKPRCSPCPLNSRSCYA